MENKPFRANPKFFPLVGGEKRLKGRKGGISFLGFRGLTILEDILCTLGGREHLIESSFLRIRRPANEVLTPGAVDFLWQRKRPGAQRNGAPTTDLVVHLVPREITVIHGRTHDVIGERASIKGNLISLYQRLRHILDRPCAFVRRAGGAYVKILREESPLTRIFDDALRVITQERIRR